MPLYSFLLVPLVCLYILYILLLIVLCSSFFMTMYIIYNSLFIPRSTRRGHCRPAAAVYKTPIRLKARFNTSQGIHRAGLDYVNLYAPWFQLFGKPLFPEPLQSTYSIIYNIYTIYCFD